MIHDTWPSPGVSDFPGAVEAANRAARGIFTAAAIGYLVGQAVRSTGKGIDKKFGSVGAACALLGCVAGNMLSAMAFFAKARGVPFAEVLANLDVGFLQRLGQKSFQAMDLLFYAIAVYEGYRFSFKFKAG